MECRFIMTSSHSSTHLTSYRCTLFPHVAGFAQSLRDFAFPSSLAAGPLQQRRPKLAQQVHLSLSGFAQSLRDFAFPTSLAAGPLQQRRPKLHSKYIHHSRDLRSRFATLHIPPRLRRGVAEHNKKSRSSKLDAIFHCVLRRVRDSNPRTR